MKVHFDIDNLPAFRNAVITIGTFDGVHGGHRKILQQVVQEAAAIGGESVLISFHPHPRMVLTNQPSVIRLINTLDERIALVSATGIDHMVIVPFTTAFAEMKAEDYVKEFLLKSFNPKTIVIGFDHRFGKERKGDFRLLEQMSVAHSFSLVEIPQEIIANNAISSTAIRKAILNGDITTANTLLDYIFFFEGLVIEGNKLGRTIGYPTANLQIADSEKLLPHNGVYAVLVKLKDKLYKGMMNIGTRPTVHGTNLTVEVHLFDFSEDIYGEKLQVFTCQFLRSEEKFNGLQALTTQLAKDEARSREVLELIA